MILYTAFQLNEYLDRQATSEIHCRTHCACCAPQRHLAGYDIPLCQLPSFMGKDVVALGRAVLPTWSGLSENEDTSQRNCYITPCNLGKRNTWPIQCGYIMVRNQNSQNPNSSSFSRHISFHRKGALFCICYVSFICYFSFPQVIRTDFVSFSLVVGLNG